MSGGGARRWIFSPRRCFSLLPVFMRRSPGGSFIFSIHLVHHVQTEMQAPPDLSVCVRACVFLCLCFHITSWSHWKIPCGVSSCNHPCISTATRLINPVCSIHNKVSMFPRILFTFHQCGENYHTHTHTRTVKAAYLFCDNVIVIPAPSGVLDASIVFTLQHMR